jgi:hypothetical protein
MDIDEGEDGAVDLVVDALVRPDVHRIPAAVPVLDLPLVGAERIDDLDDDFAQIRHRAPPPAPPSSV